MLSGLYRKEEENDTLVISFAWEARSYSSRKCSLPLFFASPTEGKYSKKKIYNAILARSAQDTTRHNIKKKKN